jgi:hypothetical protein
MKTKTEKPVMQMTFEDLTERWKTAVVPTLKTSTASYYLKILRSNIVPAFRKWSVSAIGRYDVECFMTEQAKALYSEHATRNESFSKPGSDVGELLANISTRTLAQV